MIGILALFRPNECKPLGKQTHLIEGYFRAAEEMGLEIGLFEPADLLKNRVPRGFVFRNSRWENVNFRTPRVLYDRLYSPITGFDDPVLNQKREMERILGIRYLNPLNLAIEVTDKKLFRDMMRRIGMSSPDIVCDRCSDAKTIWRKTLDFHRLILKPRFGRMGRSIIRLSRDSAGVLVETERKIFSASNQWQLHGIITELCRTGDLQPGDLMMQELIEIEQFDGRFYDIRILIQRTDGIASPMITGEVARVGGSGTAVPNIDQGGLPLPLDSWLIKLYGADAPGIHHALRAQAMEAWQRMENLYGPIGELGIDLLIDRNKKIWIVEMNSKPGRIAFERLASGFGLDQARRRHFADMRKISILNPVRYCHWLADNQGDFDFRSEFSPV